MSAARRPRVAEKGRGSVWGSRWMCSSLASAPKMVALLLLLLMAAEPSTENPDAKRLYDDLMSSYNRLIRPVSNNSDTLTIKLGLKLSQLIDVNLKNQIMTTNMWVNQEWKDHKLKWDPEEYGGVRQLYVPAEEIWLPDLVLYNNADGNYEVTIMTKAIIHDDGRVVWNPPAIYKSSCQIDVRYFPFDQQECFMKFGSWSYDGMQVDLKHLFEINGSNIVPVGMDLSEFYLSVEWDIMSVPAMRREKFYMCCIEPYPDITFNITLRRKTLFYTVNLIIPCVGLSCLSVLVFYLPSDSGEKVSLTISIMLSLTFFLLVLIEIIPSTSLAMPILGKYLIFTMTLVAFSVVVTIAILNVHFRSPSTHRMAPWVRKLFIRILPKILLMRSPQYRLEAAEDPVDTKSQNGHQLFDEDTVHAIASLHREVKLNQRRSMSVPTAPPPPPPVAGVEEVIIHELDSSPGALERGVNGHSSGYPKELDKAIRNAMFIAQHIDNGDEFESIQEDWKYVAMVLDRFFLWIFTSACILGTAGIFLQAPSLYDTSQPIDILFSKVAKSQFEYLATDSDEAE